MPNGESFCPEDSGNTSNPDVDLRERHFSAKADSDKLDEIALAECGPEPELVALNREWMCGLEARCALKHIVHGRTNFRPIDRQSSTVVGVAFETALIGDIEKLRQLSKDDEEAKGNPLRLMYADMVKVDQITHESRIKKLLGLRPILSRQLGEGLSIARISDLLDIGINDAYAYFLDNKKASGSLIHLLFLMSHASDYSFLNHFENFLNRRSHTNEHLPLDKYHPEVIIQKSEPLHWKWQHGSWLDKSPERYANAMDIRYAIQQEGQFWQRLNNRTVESIGRIGSLDT